MSVYFYYVNSPSTGTLVAHTLQSHKSVHASTSVWRNILYGFSGMSDFRNVWGWSHCINFRMLPWSQLNVSTNLPLLSFLTILSIPTTEHKLQSRNKLSFWAGFSNDCNLWWLTTEHVCEGFGGRELSGFPLVANIAQPTVNKVVQMQFAFYDFSDQIVSRHVVKKMRWQTVDIYTMYIIQVSLKNSRTNYKVFIHKDFSEAKQLKCWNLNKIFASAKQASNKETTHTDKQSFLQTLLQSMT